MFQQSHQNNSDSSQLQVGDWSQQVHQRVQAKHLDSPVNLLTPVTNLKLGGITAALMALLKHSGPETCTLLPVG